MMFHSKLTNALKTGAHIHKFGQLLSHFEMENAHNDYFHIVQIHMKDGNNKKVNDTFQFF